MKKELLGVLDLRGKKVEVVLKHLKIVVDIPNYRDLGKASVTGLCLT